MDANQKIDYLYKEYARLNEKLEEEIKGTFEDFKLFGAAGASIVLWKPIADVIVLVNPKIDYSGLLFLGFLSLLLIFTLIGYLFLLRNALMFSIASSLISFETEIRAELNTPETSQVFHLIHERDTAKFSTAYRLTFRPTLMILAIAVTLIPVVILSNFSLLYAGIYFLLALAVFVSYIQVGRKLTKLFFRNLKFF